MSDSQSTPGLHEASFPSIDGVRLHLYSIVPARPTASVLILHGYADHALRYRNVLMALAEAGFAAHALDYRGHGRAGGARGAVRKFDDYLGDVRTALARIEAAHGGKLFIVAHSHGALIAATLLSRPSAPRVAGLVLSGPYFRLKIEPSRFQLFQARFVGRLVPDLPLANPVTPAMLTRDVAMQAETAADPLRHTVVTPRWFSESNASQERLWSAAPRLKTPLLVLQGEADPVADPAAAALFVEKAGSTDKRLVVYPEMLHEIFNEQGREKPIGDAVAWLRSHLQGE